MRDFKGMKRQRNRGRGGGGGGGKTPQNNAHRALAENYLQHAEHYFRLLRAMQPQRPVAEIIGRDQFASGYDIDFEDEAQAGEESAEAEADGGQGERPWQRDDRPRDDRGQGEYRQRDDRPRDDRPRDDRPRDDRPRDDRPRDDRPREDRTREERPRPFIEAAPR